MSKHTPGPWAIVAFDHVGGGLIGPESRTTIIVRVYGGCVPKEEADANARFIVQACNSHDDLVEALRFARQFVVLAAEQGLNGALNTLEFVDAALAKARGEADA